MLGTSRENPTKSAEATWAVVEMLREAGITHLVTIGGDDTALSSRTSASTRPAPSAASTCPRRSTTICRCRRTADVRLRDGPARRRRARPQPDRGRQDHARWYIIVSMGRAAGHLALGIGKAAGATLTIIPEEFAAPVRHVRNDLRHRRGRDHQAARDGASLRRRRPGRGPHRQARSGRARRAGGRRARRARAPPVRRGRSGAKVKAELQGRLSERGLRVTITNKNVGYELRCADPIPFDAEYTRDLGYGAVRFLLGGGSGAMVSVQGGRLVPIPFDDLVDRRAEDEGPPRGHRQRGLRVARAYMIRLKPRTSRRRLGGWLADAAKLTPGTFRQRFEHLGSMTP